MKRIVCLVIFALVFAALSPCVSAGSEKLVALTLDDGPSPASEALLDGLAVRGVPVTFFLCGYRIREHPTVVRRMAKEGHELGVHGESHAYFTTMPAPVLRRELENTAGAIAQLSGREPKLVRPPGGLCSNAVRSVCAEEGLSVIHWNIDPCDWDRTARDKTVSRVLKTVKDGDIVLLHDMNETTAKNVLLLIDALRERGFSFRTVSDLAAERNAALLSGGLYAAFPATFLLPHALPCAMIKKG
ncbi:MAG: polysaccharide deacetylase family protein [Oscillospiraceae bacterium]|nr:polysaccharide deacetylase family protein [Oscillospiraceae bacterium]